jgi:glyoxylase-like metal-dependent hydrolase (beta-lactamase superfamily II)
MLRVLRVLAPNPSLYTLEGTNTWVVGADPSIVIDPGPPDPGHIAQIRHDAGDVSAVLVTHDHEDHGEGAIAFGELVGAPVLAWRLKGATRLADGATFVAGGGVELVGVHGAGHSPDHVAFLEPTERALFTGDTVVGRGTSFIDPPEGDLTRYLQTLHRMLELHPRTIYPGHGPVRTDAARVLRDYIAHREEREAEVLAGLDAGDRTVRELVARIYASYPSEVHDLAARTVTAHLLKLEHDGAVHKNGRGASQTWARQEPTACARCGRPVRGRGRYCGSCSLALLQGEAAGPA